MTNPLKTGRVGRRGLIGLGACMVALITTAVALPAAQGAGTVCKSPAGAKGPGVGATTIGFIYVGSEKDYGYNEAANAGSMALGKQCSNLKILRAENVPESAQMSQTAQKMISQGAKIIFSTSYGYEPYVEKLAKQYPQVAFLQQGNYMKSVPANANTYFGNVYETVYLAGIAAGRATKSDTLGFVAAFPIPQTLLNINAFELGAKSVNPKVKTRVVFTGNWCDPGKQAAAAKSLLSAGADVLTQHQDCTQTIIKAAEAAGKYSVGYHFNAASIAPKGWLTGSAWNWPPMYKNMLTAILTGKFTKSKFNTNYSEGFGHTNESPMNLAPYGKSVAASTKKKIETVKAKIIGGWSPFTGPIANQAGKTVIAKGKTPSAAQLAGMNYLVEGVVGSIPK